MDQKIIAGPEINRFFEAVTEPWNPLPETAVAAAIQDGNRIVAIAAAYPLFAAGGSWVVPELRGKGLSRITRYRLEVELRSLRESVYISLPRTEEEAKIFEVYGGQVTRRIAQVKEL